MGHTKTRKHTYTHLLQDNNLSVHLSNHADNTGIQRVDQTVLAKPAVSGRHECQVLLIGKLKDRVTLHVCGCEWRVCWIGCVL